MARASSSVRIKVVRRDSSAVREAARAAQLARPRRDLPGVDARPPRGVTVFAERWDESGAARLGRKNGAATSHLPVPCGFARRGRTFPPPMRRHVACSGCPYRARESLAGKRRAGAPLFYARWIPAEFPESARRIAHLA